ncbi:ATP-binding protein [Candidatus Margulisiibacteriota bacterium]
MLEIGSNIIKKDSALVECLKKTKRAFLLEELSLGPDTRAWDELKKAGGEVCVPLNTEEKMIGLFTLGPKEDEEMYDEEDLIFLNTLSNQLAIAIQKAQLHEEMMEAQARLLHADKLASLGTVAAGMAHEIKNPLASIKGMTQILESAIKDNDKESLEDFKKVVPKELDRINKLVQNLLTYSKPPTPQKAPLNINEVLEHVLKLFESEMMKKGIKLEKKLGEVPNRDLDQQQIKQVMTNFILNAIQAMPKGGKLEVKTSKAAEKVKIDILDNGLGIPEDKIKNIFDPFFSTKTSGTGLGLAITYKIIKEHAGDVQVKSKVGEGTRFTLLF